jgi:hypothetical protein
MGISGASQSKALVKQVASSVFLVVLAMHKQIVDLNFLGDVALGCFRARQKYFMGHIIFKSNDCLPGKEIKKKSQK